MQPLVSDEELFAQEMAGVKPLARDARVRLVKEALSEEQQTGRRLAAEGALETMVAEVIAANPDQVAQYLAADEAKRKKLSGFFVGQIMKASQGQANPQLLNQLLLEKLTAQS